MKKTLITILIVIVVVLLLALPKITSKKDEPKISGGPQVASVLPVEAYVVKPAMFDRKLVVTGTVLPNETIEVKGEVPGKITGIYFKEGQAVKKGEVLVKIEATELYAQLEKAKYNKKLNEDNEFRQRKLLEKEAISQEEYDNALNRLNTSNADIQLLQAQLAKTTIKAPFDGFIGFRYVSEGAYITPALVMATLYSLNPAKIEFSIPAKHATKVQVNSKIFFSVEGDTSQLSGLVYAVEPEIDPNTRTLKLRASAPNPNGIMIPGQFVTIQLVLEHLDRMILIPTEAVIPEIDGNKVFVANGGKAKEAKIIIGERTDRNIEITSGLNMGDTVLTTGILQLRQGMKINVSNTMN